jgi:hypothetical protein
VEWAPAVAIAPAGSEASPARSPHR